MKNKKTIIFSSILIFVGLVVCFIAYSFSGWNTFGYQARYGHIGFNHNRNNYSILSFDSKNSNNDKFISKSGVTKIDSFDKLDIDLNYADLVIKKSANEEFKIEVNYGNNSNNKINYNVSSDTLNVEDIFSHKSRYKNKRNEVIIHIPDKTQIKKINIYSNYGETTIDSLLAENVNIENDMGSISVTNSEIKSSEIHLEMGEFTAANTIFTNLDLENSMGSADISGQILGENELSMDMGSLTLNLNQVKSDTKLIAESDLGSISIDGTTSSGISSEQVINPEGKHSIDLEVSMGAVEINFK